MKEEIDMAYAAGILDGDGSFSIMKSNGKYYPCIQLSNAFKEMSQWLHQTFGGSLRVKKPQQPHHKTLFVWSVRGIDGCEKLIERIEKFLVLKKPQSQLMKCFLQERTNPECTDVNLERLSLKMKEYNRDVLLKKDTLTNQSIEDSLCPKFWSYVAGIMDTEGSFSIKKEKPHSGSVSARYNPVVQLTMVPADVLNFIRQNSSLGSYCIPKASCTTKGYAYKMSILSKDQCMRFIYKIINYLRFKKGQAFTLLNFCENYGSVKYCQGGIPQETLDFREEMYQQMRKLNA